MIRVTALSYMPPFAQGMMRDLRVRWALEEAGVPYEEHLIGPDEQKSGRYRALQPFGQVPVLEEDGEALFESGAIVLHIAERSPALMPGEVRDRDRVRTWSLAALNTIEPLITTLALIEMQPRSAREATKSLVEQVGGFVSIRLDSLVNFLGDSEYLIANRFTAADLIMTTVLRELRSMDFLVTRPTLDAYLRRIEERLAFQNALAAQWAAYERHPPMGH